MFSISIEVNFCYGHRLMNHSGKCKHIHGHSVKAAITVTADELDENGMVCDFSNIKKVAKSYIDQDIDHNFLLYKDDPLIPQLVESHERHRVLDEHPTAEVIAKMIYKTIKNHGFNVSKVTLWETTSTYACYQED
ncbi:MAG: 6-carboxytetrahydropterin synthase QueD [Methylococcales bacterium]